MDDNLEVFFCDLCNTSVPAQDLESKAATRHRGKIIGACCLRELRPQAAARPAASASSGGGGAALPGIVGLAVVLLAAVAGATMFLDWRFSEEVGGIRGEVSGVRRQFEAQHERVVAIEEQLGASVRRDDLAPLRTEVGELGKTLSHQAGKLEASIQSNRERLTALDGNLAGLREAHGQHQTSFARLEKEIGHLGREIAAVRAMPRTAPPPRDEPEPPRDAAAPPAQPEPDVAGLSAELQHEVKKLEDSDPGTRFEAVDNLIQSKDARVLPHLITMAKDEDPFVRRLTVEGLGDFRAAACVDALVTSLADPESIVRHAAYASLKKLTGKDFAFDPDAKPDRRRSAQRRWQEWWREHREDFS